MERLKESLKKAGKSRVALIGFPYDGNSSFTRGPTDRSNPESSDPWRRYSGIQPQKRSVGDNRDGLCQNSEGNCGENIDI